MEINFQKPLEQCVFARSCGRNHVLEQSNNYFHARLRSERLTLYITNETLNSCLNAALEPILGMLHRLDICFRGRQNQPLFKRCFFLLSAHRYFQPAPTSESSST